MRTVIEPCGICAKFRNDFCSGYEKPRRADDTNAACPLFDERKTKQPEGPGKARQRHSQRPG